MLSTILLSLVPAPAPAPPMTAPVLIRQADDVESKIAAAGEDVAKLEALAASLEEADDKTSARLVYKRILEIDDSHKASHEALRHHFYDGQWFTSYAALSKYRREEAKRMLEEHGLVRYNDEWVPEVDLPYLRMGWVKDENDQWASPAKLARAKAEAEAKAEGRQKRPEDGTWIAEADFDKWRNGEYLVNGEWVSKAEANAHHAEILTPWRFESDHFIVYSTNDADMYGWITFWAEQTYDELVRLYGVQPTEKPVLACLKDLTQYNAFAAGDQAAGLPPMETGGFSSLHFAFFGDVWFDLSNPQAPEYIGGGVAYYEPTNEAMAPWGQYSVRHAAGLSFGEYIDRDWETVSQLISNQGGGGAAPDSLWANKRVPRWMLYGGASFVERFKRDAQAEAAGDSPWGIRGWAFDQVNKQPINPPATIFSMPLDINNIEGSARLIVEAGVVVSFIMDGDCEPVQKAHAEFKAAMKSGGDTKEAVAALEKAVIDNTDALLAFSKATIKSGDEAAPVADDAAGN